MDVNEALLMVAIVTAAATSLSAVIMLGVLMFAAREVGALTKSRYVDVALQIHREFADLFDERQFVIYEVPRLLAENSDPDALPVEAEAELLDLLQAKLASGRKLLS